ncbi:protease SohB [Thiohalomonas denitrificans]|uniref:Serine protease SohB n=1 Tax=Thiohalomonas denitrificans TaxID=415747 RepID=A0A1G5QVF0_9GAMM|nr:protease SohB [Thiohalomonas denitrificans]SCZ65833.1 serine protease SohB [Thiohalomonas denitrificans]
MAYLGEYLLFVAETITIVAAVFALVVLTARALRQSREDGARLQIRHLNPRYRQLATRIEAASLPKRELKRLLPHRGRQERKARRVFVIRFTGDLRASAVRSLREEVTAILSTRQEGDSVVVCLESLGGVVASYGLAASQLTRLRDNGLPLTVCVDRVAASGGYMMAAVADHPVAAPFAIVGSIGVVAQLPNFHRLLKQHNIDFEQFQAGAYKRTVTLFGETSDEDRRKLQSQVDETFELFQSFLIRYRPRLDLQRVATGEYWYGSRAEELGLIDEIGTSDDHLLALSREAELYELNYRLPPQRRRWLFR